MIKPTISIKGKISSNERIQGKTNASFVYPELEELIVMPSEEEQTFISEKYGFSSVTIEGDSNLKSENIKIGTSIFGIEGNLADTSDANAIAANLLSNRTAYVNNKKISGTMSENGDEYIIPSENEQSLSSGYYSEIVVAPLTDSDYYIYCLNKARLILGIDKVVGRNLQVYYWGNNLIDRTENKLDGTLTGSYTQNENETITFSGGYGITGNINRARGAFEIYCAVSTSYSPDWSSDWFRSGCLIGCELPGTQQDFGIVINKNGYFGIGYSTSSIINSGIAARDGKFHHLVLNVTGTDFTLYIDGVKKGNVSYAMSGDVPVNYGIFWNKSETRSIVKGNYKLFRYYTEPLTEAEINHNYQCCLWDIKEFEKENE